MPQRHGSYKLCQNEYWLMGNGYHSYDSRYLGIITESSIYGKVLLLGKFKQRFW
jgi:type IV secretory pathway protease TraF